MIGGDGAARVPRPGHGVVEREPGRVGAHRVLPVQNNPMQEADLTRTVADQHTGWRSESGASEASVPRSRRRCGRLRTPAQRSTS